GVQVDSIKVQCGGVSISGSLGLPKWVYQYVLPNDKSSKKYTVSIKNLVIDTGGIKFSGSIEASNLSFGGKFGLDKLKLTYDQIQDEFGAEVRLKTPLLNLDAGATI